MTTSYPSFPNLNGTITQNILSLVMWVIETILTAFVIGIQTIASDIYNSVGSTITSIVEFPAKIFDQTVSDFSGYGILAPILASIIWGVSIIILVFLLLKASQIGASEITNEV